MSRSLRINVCIVCGKSFEARKRKYKVTCSSVCGLKNMQRWMEKSQRLARDLHKEDTLRTG